VSSLPKEQTYFEPLTQPIIPIISLKTIQDENNLKEVVNHSKLSSQSQELTGPLLPRSKISTKDGANDFIVEDSSYKKAQSGSSSYSYSYSVNGGSYGPLFSKEEKSNGYLTKGKYSVVLPDGRLQTVSYFIDGDRGVFC